MDFSSIRLITFDCYGTLIDWETGMLAALRPLFSREGRQVSDLQLLEHYGEIEAELEAGPYLPYKQVLSQTVQEMGRRLGATISEDDGSRFAQSLTSWEPFPDTVAGLHALSRRFRLGVISNIDDDLFAVTKKKLGVEFSLIVTAQQVQSYKPSLRNFQEAMARSGLKKQEILHAAQSLYHDVVPANLLGIRNAWVNRPSIRPGSGAAKPAVAQPTVQVSSVAELAQLLLK
ncbi:MAG: haloacid dehalogenase type II [Acidobacteriia bacterium]|nr:haloacid dehalogenase type II [Terriglobia bacterium]